MKTFLIILTAVVLLGCVSDSDSFAEIVKETPGGQVKSVELFVLPNGLAFERIEGEKVEIKTFKIDPAISSGLIKEVQDLQTYARASKNECNDCDGFQVFFKKDGRIGKFFFNNSPDYAETVFEKIKTGLREPTGEQFLLRFAFQKIGSDVVDYHVFGDGTAVRSVFGAGPGDLKESKTLQLEEDKVERIKEKIKDKVSENDDLKSCFKAGLVYGYFEVIKNNEYSFSFTCGVEKTSQSEVYRFLVQELK